MSIFNHALTEMWFEVIGEGIPILILHGYELDHHCMKNILEPLFKKKDNFKRIYLDIPGMGKSIVKPGLNNADDMLQILKDFIDTIIPKESFSIIGMSYGAYLGRGLWLDSKLLINNGLWICPVIKAKLSERMLPSLKVSLKDKDFLKTLQEQDYLAIKDWIIVQNREVYEDFSRDIKLALEKGQKEFLEKYSRKGYSFKKEINQTISSRKCTFICGKSDTMVGYIDTVNLISRYENADLFILSRAGHYVQRERQSTFETITKEWLASHLVLFNKLNIK